MPTYTSGDVEIFYRSSSPSSGGSGQLPVLLLHGFALNGGSFEPQIAALGSRYRFLAPDARGFGRSGLGQGPTEMSTLARDALRLLDVLEISRAVVLGVSMGGYAALAMLREDPSRVAGLVLADSRATAEDEAGRQRREETARSVLSQGTGVLVDAMMPKMLSPQASPAVRTTVESQIRSASPAGAAAASRGMALRPDARELLARYGGPALFIVGERDEITPPAAAREMAGLVKGAELEILPGAGHLANQEAPEAFNRVLDTFLRRL